MISPPPVTHQPTHQPTTVTTSNVKGHFKVQAPVTLPDCLKDYVICHNNYWMVRPPHPIFRKLVYTVFYSSGHINVSGIKDFDDCDHAQLLFEQLFNVASVSQFCIDNSTSTGQLCMTSNSINLSKLKLTENIDTYFAFPCTVSLRPHYFPGALIRPAKITHEICTSILFSNGKFNIVGAKHPAQVARTVHNLQQMAYRVFL